MDQSFNPLFVGDQNHGSIELGGSVKATSDETGVAGANVNVQQRKANGYVHEQEPLSLRFIHKPSRNREMLEKATDRTRENSILNSQLKGTGDTDEKERQHEDEKVTENREVNSQDSIPFHSVRKKSGEVVKSSMKDGWTAITENMKRSRSLPSTPTYKSVHFGNDNDVRYFKEKDKPNAISASNSPRLDVEQFAAMSLGNDGGADTKREEEMEDYFGDRSFSLSSPENTVAYKKKEFSVKWELDLINIPQPSYDKYIKMGYPLFLERIFISADKKYLIGHVAVKNLSFEKKVVARYTADDWLTIVELPTSYVSECPLILSKNNYDRFVFKVPLESLFNSYKITTSPSSDVQRSRPIRYSLCIKFKSNAGEFWDNNDFKNYEFQLTKVQKAGQNSKISAHKSRPKYSSSYLKRRKSDSEIEVSNSAAKDDNSVLYNNENTSSDYVSNDFYLSSPLLSCYNNAQFLEDTQLSDKSVKNTFRSIDEIVGKQQTPSEGGQKDMDTNVHRNDSTFQGIHSPTSHSLHQYNSYQELLDNYCFFSSPPLSDVHDNILFPSSTSNVNSGSTDASPSSRKTATGESTGTDHNSSRVDRIQTVSSILNEDEVM